MPSGHIAAPGRTYRGGVSWLPAAGRARPAPTAMPAAIAAVARTAPARGKNPSLLTMSPCSGTTALRAYPAWRRRWRHAGTHALPPTFVAGGGPAGLADGVVLARRLRVRHRGAVDDGLLLVVRVERERLLD